MKTTYGMKISLFVVLILLGSFARGQEIASAPAAKAACGPENVKFEVKLVDQSQQPILNPGSSKAVVYILHDYPRVPMVRLLTTRMGVDGAWVGANEGRSYFGFVIDPGVHHLCVSGQWGRLISPPSIVLHRVAARAGETYYFRVRFLNSGIGGIGFDLEAVDEDEGQFLRQTSMYSTSHPK